MKFWKLWRGFMFRPLIYLTAFRLMVSLIFLLIVVRFVPNGPSVSMAAGFLTVLFALFGYLVYLRTDGLGIPRLIYWRPKKKNDPLRKAASMNDHMDDDPGMSFEELEPEEKDLCSLLANLFCFIIFLVVSLITWQV